MPAVGTLMFPEPVLQPFRIIAWRAAVPGDAQIRGGPVQSVGHGLEGHHVPAGPPGRLAQ